MTLLGGTSSGVHLFDDGHLTNSTCSTVGGRPITLTPQLRTCGRGSGLDHRGDDETRVADQRRENFSERRPTRKLRFPWLYPRATPLPKWWSLVSAQWPVADAIFGAINIPRNLTVQEQKAAWVVGCKKSQSPTIIGITLNASHGALRTFSVVKTSHRIPYDIGCGRQQ